MALCKALCIKISPVKKGRGRGFRCGKQGVFHNLHKFFHRLRKMKFVRVIYILVNIRILDSEEFLPDFSGPEHFDRAPISPTKKST